MKVHRELGQVREKGVDIWVDRALLFPDWSKRTGLFVPPLIEEQGLALPMQIPGTLHAWLRTRRGSWAGLVSYRVPTVLGELPMFHLAPKESAPKRLGPFEEEPF